MPREQNPTLLSPRVPRNGGRWVGVKADRVQATRGEGEACAWSRCQRAPGRRKQSEVGAPVDPGRRGGRGWLHTRASLVIRQFYTANSGR